MNSIAICIPAIIDLNLISSNVKSIKKNFIDCNQDYKFNVFEIKFKPYCFDT